MNIVNQFRWIDKRSITGFGTECVVVIAECTPHGWEFFERDALGCTWYKVEPTEAFMDKVVELSMQHRPAQASA